MTNNNENDHHVRFEVASERRTIREYSLIPESDPAAKEQHISEHMMLQYIQRLAQNGDYLIDLNKLKHVAKALQKN